MRAIPPKVVARFALLALILVAAFLALRWPPIAERLTQENVLALFDDLRGRWWAPVLLVVLHMAASAVGIPASPLVVTAGAVFGPVLGTVLNLVGLLLGAFLGYQMARGLGRDLVRHLAGDRLRRAERLFDRRGFWPLVSIRFFPLPFTAINFGAALAGVRLPIFMTTTALGLLPTITMHTTFAAWLIRAPEGRRAFIFTLWGLIWLSLAMLTAIPTLRTTRRRRKRYAELLEQRRLRRRR